MNIAATIQPTEKLGPGLLTETIVSKLGNPETSSDFDFHGAVNDALKDVGPAVGTGNPINKLYDYLHNTTRGSHPQQYGTTTLTVKDLIGSAKDDMQQSIELQGVNILVNTVTSFGPARQRGGSSTFPGQSEGSSDPNELDSSGFGDAGFIQPDGTISYFIHFENVAPAGVPANLILPAQEVEVTDALPASLDLSTVELTAARMPPPILAPA